MPSSLVVSFVLFAAALSAESVAAQTWEVELDSRQLWQVSDAEAAEHGGVVRRRCSVLADAAGTLSFDLRSVHLDPVLRVLAADGSDRALDDDGGLEWNAHLELQVEAGERVEFEAISQGPHRGELELEVSRGAPRPLEGDELREALARFRLGRGGFQAEIGFALRGAQELNSAGELFHSLDLRTERREAYTGMLDAALSLPESAPERALFELVARTQLVSVMANAGERDLAAEHLAISEALAARVEHPAVELLLARGRAIIVLLSDDFDIETVLRASDEYVAVLAANDQRSAEAVERLSLIERLFNRGELEAAEERLPAVRALVGELDDPKVAAHMVSVESRAARARGAHEDAGALARRAVDLAVTKLQRAKALLQVASSHEHAGRYGAAFAAYDEVMHFASELDYGELRAVALQGAAIVAVFLEDETRAVALLRESLKHTEASHARLNVIDRSLQLCDALLSLGRVAEAESLMETVAGEASLSVNPAIEFRLAMLNVELAERRADLAEAQRHSRVALELARASGVERLISYGLAEEARWLLEVEGADAASPVALESLQSARRAGDADVLSDALIFLSRVQFAAGALSESLASFAEAESVLLDGWAAQLDERWAERLRAVKRSERLSRLGQDLSAAQLAAAAPASEEWHALFAQGLRRADRWKGRDLLSRLSAGREEAATERTELLHALESRLASDDCQLVHFAEGESQLYAYVLDGGERRHVALGKLASVSAEVDGYLEHIARPASLGSVEQVARDGALLHDRLVLPLELSPSEGELLVIDSGALAGLPLEALVVAAVDTPSSFEDLRFLLDDRRVTYSPSASALALSPRVLRQPRTSDLVVLADPQFDAAGAGSSGSATLRADSGFDRLPGTRSEALAIARSYLSQARSPGEVDALLGDSQSGGLRLDSDGLRLRLGKEATRSALLEFVEGAAIVHLATHGVQDSHEPRRSALALSPSGDDAGRLFLGEILDWKLSAELAVLSACETASGANRHGEGTRSLAWSFLRAGAEAVVASHWQVDDRESEVLMRAFYEDYLHSRDASRALHSARLGLRHASAERGAFLGVGRGKRLGPRPVANPDRNLAGHPFFWASFVHVRAREDGAFLEAPTQR
ncbi:MAG: hypothetical protein DHS20C15_29580 [Planctomycetota bacterium]|nr:MAG: hypothetical protein DHS20C15_29580 [Planctomycetota bacterium]